MLVLPVTQVICKRRVLYSEETFANNEIDKFLKKFRTQYLENKGTYYAENYQNLVSMHLRECVFL